jgi:hypothetical protein
MNLLFAIPRFFWSRRTTTMGYLTVMWSVIEMNPETVGQWVTAPRRGIVLLIIGMVNAALGHYNQSVINRKNQQ